MALEKKITVMNCYNKTSYWTVIWTFRSVCFSTVLFFLDLRRFFSFLIRNTVVQLRGRGSARRKVATYTQDNTNGININIRGN
jgi:hypothetical protein